MSSRRRNSKKNLGNSISDIQRRIRRMERKPIRTRLQNRVIKGSAIAPSTITAEEVSFGTTVITTDTPADVIDNPKEGTTVVDPDTGATQVYSADINEFITLTDPEAQATADGKAKTYVQNDEPTGGAYNVGDLWIDTNDGNKLYRYSGTAWVSAQDGAISTAQSTANGKNKVYYDTVAPGSTANTAGDIWWQYASGIVIGQYVGAGGTSWTSAPIGNAVIANLDAGKITTGYLDVAGTVKITTSATASGTGGNTARIEINSSGFFAYNGSTATVSITNSGTALFTGTITGSTITGGTVRTAATGRRIEITSTGSGAIYFYDANSTYNGVISSTDYGMYFYGPGSDLGLGAKMVLYSDENPTSALTGLAAIFSGGAGDVTLNTATNTLRVDGATAAVSLSASTPVTTYGLRNVRGFTIFDPATNSTGVDGDIAVVYS